MMRVLLFTKSYRPEPSGIGPYSGGLAEDLVSLGHQVAVVCAVPSYPHWETQAGYSASRWSRSLENGVRIYRCPIYVPRKVSAARRILHYVSFAASSVFPMLALALRFRPNVVIKVVPTLVAAPLALLSARIGGARSWLHVQDFETEAAVATGELGNGFIASVAQAFERSCIKSFDHASSISPEMCAKLADKRGGAPVYELRNWAEIDTIRPQKTSRFRRLWGITTPYVALYSGSIAAKQGIELLVEVARNLRHRTDLTFVICGNGPGRQLLETSAENLPNIIFKDLQPAQDLNELLNLATVHLLPQKGAAADLVLPSKLTNMLASGKPVVATAAAGTGLARELEGCGIATPPEQAEPMAFAIERLLSEPELHLRLSSSARERAEARWSRKKITAAFSAELSRISAVRSLVS